MMSRKKMRKIPGRSLFLKLKPFEGTSKWCKAGGQSLLLKLRELEKYFFYVKM
jgi:hypothetical protein